MSRSKGKNSLDNLNISRTESPDESKVFNVKFDFSVFVSVCDAFKGILGTWEVEENLTDEVLERLVEIQNVIKKKMSVLKTNRAKPETSPMCKLRSLSLSESTQSLRSEESFSAEAEGLSNDPNFQRFLEIISCPFCFRVQDNLKNFVKHLNTNCKGTNLVKKNSRMEYSYFQILPNNSFKCNICFSSVSKNLKFYFLHLNRQNHITNRVRESGKKNFTEFLFCSVCKVLVPNTYTQIDFHIRNDPHKSGTGDIPSIRVLRNKGVVAQFSRGGKFKCFSCNSGQNLSNAKAMLTHLDEPEHKKKNVASSSGKSILFCEPCRAFVKIFEVVAHFQSEKHAKKECESFELCFFCGEICSDLLELSSHMTTKCDLVRKVEKMEEKEETEPKPEPKAPEVAQEHKGGRFVYVKGDAEALDILKYFKKLGEIISVDFYGSYLKIEFRDQSTVDNVMVLRKSIKIDGKILEVTQNPEEVSASSDEGSGSEDSVGSTEPAALTDDEIKNLFKRVSQYLVRRETDSNIAEAEKVLNDCLKTLRCSACALVGFQECNLSFPKEGVSIICQFSEPFSMKMDEYSGTLIKKNHSKLLLSNSWTNVVIHLKSSVPHISCVHTESQKECRLYFDYSVHEITDYLRKCVEESEVVVHFCYIFRFWLMVQELNLQNHELAVMSLLVFFCLSAGVVDFDVRKSLRQDDCSILNQIIMESSADNRNDPKLTKKVKKSVGKSLTVSKLFDEFLRFWNDFDFQEYVICLPLDFPVPKSAFRSEWLKSLLGEEKLAHILSAPLSLLNSSCSKNFGADVSQKDLKAFLTVVRKTIKG